MTDLSEKLQEVADRRGQIEDNLYKLLYKWCADTDKGLPYLHLWKGYHVRPGDSELYWHSYRTSAGPTATHLKELPTKVIIALIRAWPDRLATYKNRIR